MPIELSAEQLRRHFDPQGLAYETSAEAEPTTTIIGQERAVRSLQFGLGVESFGFNIYVAGPPGTGRETAAERFLKQIAATQPVPADWCYVNNFQDAYRPKSLSLPPGRARAFQKDMGALIKEAQEEIGRAFESDDYLVKQEEIEQRFQGQHEDLFREVNQRAEQAGFAIQASRVGLLTVPLREGKPLSEEAFSALNSEEKAAITTKQEQLQKEIKAFLRQARHLQKQMGERLEQLDQEVALFALTPLIEELQDKYDPFPQIITHLKTIQEDILENLDLFREEPLEQPANAAPEAVAREQLFRRYQVNLLVDNGERQGAPVITEANPTYSNLFGRIEKEAQFGTLITDFTLIREGSLHRANGGYLVLPANELMRNPSAWDTLKRALRNEEIVIEEPTERQGVMAAKSLRPEPIPLEIKVILIGQSSLYQLLYLSDKDFSELFKVKADFDTTMPRTAEGIKDYVSFIAMLCQNEGIKDLDRTAMAKVIEHGSRMAQDREKLSTRFGELSDVIREAHYYAQQEEAAHIRAAHIKRAVDERVYRSSLLRDKVREAIARDTILIDVTGKVAGQVNGLSIVNTGDLIFGRPNRITASAGLGQKGLIDIEREAKLGGPLHSKGVMILSGYLAQKYVHDKPLSLSARLVFEQSYAGVEGDSASSAELYALLSRLADLPIRQDIAVTGSVNQQGDLQPIGRVNEKIEGFFEICQAKGLTGKQGVLIPQSNLKNLMVREDVVEAVAAGRFHVWAARTVDEGIELLTGVPAGQRQPDGSFEPGTVNARLDQRLREMAVTLKTFAKSAIKAAAEADAEEEEKTSEEETTTP